MIAEQRLLWERLLSHISLLSIISIEIREADEATKWKIIMCACDALWLEQDHIHLLFRCEVTFIFRVTTTLISIINLSYLFFSRLTHLLSPNASVISHAHAFRCFPLPMLAALPLSATTIASGTFCLDFYIPSLFLSLHFNNAVQFERILR